MTRPSQDFFDPVSTQHTTWQPAQAQVTVNARCDARIVPSAASPEGARVAYSHVAVLDDFIDEPTRSSLLALLTAEGWDHSQGPPERKWERATADGAGLSRTWGLTHTALQELRNDSIPAMTEVQSRLAKLYPDFGICHMPSHAMQHAQSETLFLDGETDVGLVIRPMRCRAVLMDQDVLHRLSPPSKKAGPDDV
ncbi:hypothetical protein WJX73_002680 [Symbiochloris irregularis]|uniref:Uncharacterized protein n=1 Tax=Symbiochloris irregularis TaxID=706552 RepID=A0AAW1PCU5_9CHLO